jgi:lipoate-protein ligase A
MNLHDFKAYLENYIKDTYSIKSSYILTSSDIEKIEEIAQKRFRTASWNFGKNTSYNISSSIVLSSGILDFNLAVKNNIIHDFKIFGDFFGENSIEELEMMFIGLELEKEKIYNALADICICDFIMGLDKESFISALIETIILC